MGTGMREVFPVATGLMLVVAAVAVVTNNIYTALLALGLAFLLVMFDLSGAQKNSRLYVGMIVVFMALVIITRFFYVPQGAFNYSG